MTVARRSALILFAKDPVEGRVKTRLGSLLDPKTTLNLYLCFLDDSIAKIHAVAKVDRFIGVASEPQTGYFENLSYHPPARLFVQEGEDLGQRMHRAFEDRFQEGYQRVVIIGSDSPTLPTAYIEQALQSEKEVVIGPSTDGGYYLIGMRGMVTELFAGIDWGTGRVLADTLKALQEQGVPAGLLPVWYDVDLPEDLRFLKTHLEWMAHAGLKTGLATFKFLNQRHLEPVK